MFARIAGIAVIGLSATTLVGCADEGNVEAVTQNRISVSLPAGTFETCTSDDAENSPCVWDERVDGNTENVGMSFVTLGNDGQEIAYITSREAKSLKK